MRKKGGLIFVISGPSGTGKTTLIKSLLKDKDIKRILKKSISFTTRPKRMNEKDGKDYFFITQDKFKELLKRKKILEWTKYLDYYYATPKDYLNEQLRKARHVVLCLDTKGAARIKRLYPHNTVTIFILPPKIETLRQRIRLRSKRAREKNLLKRLSLAKREIAASVGYDYRIVNDDLRVALKKLKDIVTGQIGSCGEVYR